MLQENTTDRTRSREEDEAHGDTPGTSRRFSTPPAREPYHEEPARGMTPAQAETAPPADPPDITLPERAPTPILFESIDTIVARVGMPATQPMQNLPELPLPEHKVIGRCVVFKGDTLVDGAIQPLFYQGLVATINKDTISLIQVYRFTEEDFRFHCATEEELKRTESAEMAVDRAVARWHSTKHGAPSAGIVDGAGKDGASATNATVEGSLDDGSADGDMLRLDTTVSSSLRPSDQADGQHAASNKRVRNRMRNNKGSMGPIPFASFSRSNIREVEFGRDPRSTFYSLFRDPTKEFFDMQCLRMFCRRYVVHTSQGNNPRGIPLRPFVTCRCNCPDLDQGLLERVALEEVAHLLKVTREYKSDRKRKARTAQQRERAATMRAGDVRAYQAPPGIFRSTGILHAFKIPHRLLAISIVQLLLAIALAVSFGISQMTADPNVIAPYARENLVFVVICVVIAACSAVMTAVTSSSIHVPVAILSFRYAPVLLALLGSIACGVLCAVMSARFFSGIYLLVFIHDNHYIIRLDAYYTAFRCSGYVSSCASETAQQEGSVLCPSGSQQFENPCRYVMLRQVGAIMIPAVVLSAVTVLMSTMLVLTLHKAVRVSAQVANGAISIRRERAEEGE